MALQQKACQHSCPSERCACCPLPPRLRLPLVPYTAQGITPPPCSFVVKGWLSSILQTFETAPRAGIVGPLFLGDGGLITEAGGLVFQEVRAVHAVQPACSHAVHAVHGPCELPTAQLPLRLLCALPCAVKGCFRLRLVCTCLPWASLHVARLSAGGGLELRQGAGTPPRDVLCPAGRWVWERGGLGRANSTPSPAGCAP